MFIMLAVIMFLTYAHATICAYSLNSLNTNVFTIQGKRLLIDTALNSEQQFATILKGQQYLRQTSPISDLLHSFYNLFVKQNLCTFSLTVPLYIDPKYPDYQIITVHDIFKYTNVKSAGVYLKRQYYADIIHLILAVDEEWESMPGFEIFDRRVKTGAVYVQIVGIGQQVHQITKQEAIFSFQLQHSGVILTEQMFENLAYILDCSQKSSYLVCPDDGPHDLNSKSLVLPNSDNSAILRLPFYRIVKRQDSTKGMIHLNIKKDRQNKLGQQLFEQYFMLFDYQRMQIKGKRVYQYRLESSNKYLITMIAATFLILFCLIMTGILCKKKKQIGGHGGSLFYDRNNDQTLQLYAR